jgi:hypothetical protein
MAVLAVSASCHIPFTHPVHPLFSNHLSSKASLQLFCRNALLFYTRTDSEESNV